jgi:hypothetical protein
LGASSPRAFGSDATDHVATIKAHAIHAPGTDRTHRAVRGIGLGPQLFKEFLQPPQFGLDGERIEIARAVELHLARMAKPQSISQPNELPLDLGIKRRTNVAAPP